MAEKQRVGKATATTLNVKNTLSLAGTPLTPTFAQLNAIGAAAGTVPFDRSIKVARVALAAVDTAGGVFSWQNPEASAVLVHRVIVDATTKATAACSVDVGATASSGTTSANNLLNGLDVGTAAGTFDNIQNPGVAGKPIQKVAAGKWVTASKASGATAGLVGFAYIHYILS